MRVGGRDVARGWVGGTWHEGGWEGRDTRVGGRDVLEPDDVLEIFFSQLYSAIQNNTTSQLAMVKKQRKQRENDDVCKYRARNIQAGLAAKKLKMRAE